MAGTDSGVGFSGTPNLAPNIFPQVPWIDARSLIPAGTMASGDGITVDDSAIRNADLYAIARGCALAFTPGDYRIAAPLTVNAPVIIFPGAVIAPDAGVVVTFAEAIWAPLVYCFDPAAGASVVFSKAREAYPEWWGAKDDGGTIDSAAAIRAAVAARTGRVVLSGRYGISSPITGIGGGGAQGGQQFVGLGMQMSGLVVRGGFVGAQALLVNGGPNPRIANLKIEGGAGVRGIEIESDSTAIENVFSRGGSEGFKVTRGNCMRWMNAYAESCVDGFVLEPAAGTDDINGGILLGLRAYGCSGWGLDVRQGGAGGPSYNRVDFSAETGTNGVRVRGGRYCEYSLYVEGMSGDDYDLDSSPHEWKIKNTDNDATVYPEGSTGTGWNGTGSQVYPHLGPAGTWVPTLVSLGGADPASVTYSAQVGNYRRVGKGQIVCDFLIALSAIDKTGVGGTVAIGGWPFEAANSRDHCSVYFDTLLAARSGVLVESRAGADKKFYVLDVPAAGAVSSGAMSWSAIGAATVLQGSLTYFTP